MKAKKQGTKDLIADLKRKIESEESWQLLLYKKKRLQEELSEVQMKITIRCIDASLTNTFYYKKKLRELEKPTTGIKKPNKRKKGKQ